MIDASKVKFSRAFKACDHLISALASFSERFDIEALFDSSEDEEDDEDVGEGSLNNSPYHLQHSSISNEDE